MAYYSNKEKIARHEFMTQTIQKVKEIPVEEIVGSVVKLYPRGKYYMGLCPFHPDNHLGSFVVTPSMGLWRCFSEGIGGTGITFEMEYYGLSFLDAVFKLALDYDIISDDEYKTYSRKKYDSIEVEAYKRIADPPRTTNHIIASNKVMHNVYQAMINEFPLTEEHRKHLLNERKLKEGEFKDYFSFPSRRTNVPARVLSGIRNGISKSRYGFDYDSLSKDQKLSVDKSMERTGIYDELKYVPGFYLDKEKNKVDFMSYSGIGIASRDVNGNILGVQIRRDKLKDTHSSRYIWFSSSFAFDNENYDGGASPGSPAGVIFPKCDGKDKICITEGRFKAEKIADTGNLAIFVCGVSNWAPALNILDNLPERYQCKPVYLMYDADIFGNTAVYKQLKSFAFELKKRGRKVYVLTWSKARGKGFDDLYIAEGEEYSKYMRMKDFDSFIRAYEKVLRKVLSEFQVSDVKEISASNVDEFKDALQSMMEKEFDLC